MTSFMVCGPSVLLFFATFFFFSNICTLFFATFFLVPWGLHAAAFLAGFFGIFFSLLYTLVISVIDGLLIDAAGPPHPWSGGILSLAYLSALVRVSVRNRFFPRPRVYHGEKKEKKLTDWLYYCTAVRGHSVESKIICAPGLEYFVPRLRLYTADDLYVDRWVNCLCTQVCMWHFRTLKFPYTI